MSHDQKFVNLGNCRRPHGIKGAFSFHLENSESSVLKKGVEVKLIPIDKTSSILEKGEIFTIKHIGFGNKVIVFLEGIENRNMVEEMIPFKIQVSRDTFPKLSSGEYYLNDLIGLEVFDFDSKEFIGKIKNFYESPAQVILVIKTKNEDLELPLVDHFVPTIDIDNCRVEVKLPEFIE